jgi:ATP-dependent DNA helicase 2 subunit 1
VLFAIDVSDSMLAPLEPDSTKANQDSAAIASLKCAYQLMQQRIISNPSDMMGVLLFGTEKSKVEGESDGKGPIPYPHCYLLTDLDIPAADDVKKLRDLVQSEDESSILVASSEPVSMANVLFCANQIFTTKAPNFSSRRLFVVTDNDNPHAKDKALRDAAAVRAKDLYDLGVTIDLFPIAQHGRDFDREKFYNVRHIHKRQHLEANFIAQDIVYNGSPTDPDAPAPVVKATKTVGGDGLSLLQSLISSINSKATPRRSYFNLPLDIAPDFRIGVKGYVMIRRQQPVKSCWVWVGGERLQMAVSSTTTISEDTARKVEAAEINKSYQFGGELLPFKEDEHKAIRSFGEPVIRIIGFKPLSLLPEWANCRTATFIYPDEADYIGSTRAFSALQQELLRKEKFALVWLQTRRNAAPSLAAMIAGVEKLDDSGDQIMPPGMWIIALPFADDIRPHPESVQVRAPDDLVDKMKTIILQLRMPKGTYDPQRFPNPCKWY